MSEESYLQTRDGEPVEIDTLRKPGMSIFVVCGKRGEKIEHWTIDGMFRADDKEDPRDIVGWRDFLDSEMIDASDRQ